MSYLFVTPELPTMPQERSTLASSAYPRLDLTASRARTISGLGAYGVTAGTTSTMTKLAPSSSLSPGAIGTKTAPPSSSSISAPKTWSPATPSFTVREGIQATTSLVQALAPVAGQIYTQRSQAEMQRRAARAGMPPLDFGTPYGVEPVSAGPPWGLILGGVVLVGILVAATRR